MLLADQWPQWRGPNGNGLAPDQNAPTEWNDKTNIGWRAEVPGRGHSSPVVVGDPVILATASCEPGRAQMIVAYDRSTGTPKWERVIFKDGLPDGKKIHPKATYANSTVACNGQEQWKKRLGGNFSSSPVICDGRVFVANLDGKCFVFEASSEKFTSVAENQLGGDCYACPAFAGGEIFVRIGMGSGQKRREYFVCVRRHLSEQTTQQSL